MRDLSAAERKLQTEMLKSPNRWPRWPVLPMKNRLRPHMTGFFVTADYPTILLKQFPTMQGILLQLACEDGIPIPGGKGLSLASDAERRVYEDNIEARFQDIDAMLDAGWAID